MAVWSYRPLWTGTYLSLGLLILSFLFPSHLPTAVSSCSGACVLVSWVCSCACGCVEVVGDVKWQWQWCLIIQVPGKTRQTCGAGFWTGTSWQTQTHTCATYIRLPTRVCKPITGTIENKLNQMETTRHLSCFWHLVHTLHILYHLLSLSLNGLRPWSSPSNLPMWSQSFSHYSLTFWPNCWTSPQVWWKAGNLLGSVDSQRCQSCTVT